MIKAVTIETKNQSVFSFLTLRISGFFFRIRDRNNYQGRLSPSWQYLL